MTLESETAAAWQERPADRSIDQEEHEALQEFIDEGVVTRVLGALKSGKEATVYRCASRRAETGYGVVAVKVYRSASFRDFRNSAAYTEGRVIVKGQVRRAVEKKTAAGKGFEAAMWVNREFDVLSELYEAGADVPEPLFATDRAILMEYVGGEEAAPQLQHARLNRGAAGRLLERLLWNIELWLDHHIVHADLSPFNVLLWDGRPKVIDFPQAVDARTNGNARHLLERDIANVCRHFERLNPGLDPGDVARKLWSRYRLGYLG